MPSVVPLHRSTGTRADLNRLGRVVCGIARLQEVLAGRVVQLERRVAGEAGPDLDGPQGRQLQLVADEDTPVMTGPAGWVGRPQRRPAGRLLRVVETSALVLVGGLVLAAVSLPGSGDPPVGSSPTWRAPVRQAPAGGQQGAGGDAPAVAVRPAAGRGTKVPPTTTSAAGGQDAAQPGAPAAGVSGGSSDGRVVVTAPSTTLPEVTSTTVPEVTSTTTLAQLRHLLWCQRHPWQCQQALVSGETLGG
jgi:hypothetical protein